MGRVMSEARVTVPARIGGATVQARTTVQPRITGQARVAAVRAVQTARFHRRTLCRMLAAGTLVCGPPAYGTEPPVRTPVPATVTAAVAIGAPAGVVGGSTVRVEVGVTGGDGPTPARVHGGLRTAVAHAPLAPP